MVKGMYSCRHGDREVQLYARQRDVAPYDGREVQRDISPYDGKEVLTYLQNYLFLMCISLTLACGERRERGRGRGGACV